MSEYQKIKSMLRLRSKSTGKDWSNFLSSGSTLLNLACTGRSRCCFSKGHYYLLVGDSTSGKTFLTLTCFAEAMQSKHFQNYRLIHDNPEQGALMDIGQYFGSKVAKRIEPPSKRGMGFSSTIEEFYYNLDDAFEKGEPFLYVLDSHDALTSDQDQDKFKDAKAASRKGREAKGSFGMSKAKANSEYLRQVISKLKKTGSILIIISQTRDNIGFGFETKTRAGGRALRFYATVEMWSSVRQSLTKAKRNIGILAQVQIKKNRFTGKNRKVTFPIYHSTGIDDVGGMVDFLLEEKHWRGSTINAEEFEVTMKREKLIRHIEQEGLERDLQKIVAGVWNGIEDKLVVKRKRRYE